MTKRTFIFIASCFVALLGAFLIPPVVAQNSNLSPRTTTWSRQFLTNTTAAGAFATIGSGFREQSITPGATISIYASNRVETLGAFWQMGEDEYVKVEGTHPRGMELILKITADNGNRQVTLATTNFLHPEGSSGRIFVVALGTTTMLRFISDGSYFCEVDGRVVRGMVKMWSGNIASIPDGWVLCNGINGSPDLRNRFVVAANADSGGIAMSTIEGAAAQTGGAPNAIDLGAYSTTGTFTPVALATTAITGYTGEVPIVPAFYALAYIYKL